MPVIEFSVQRWGCWPPAAEMAGESTTPNSADAGPNLDFVPALMRRRLSPLSKALFNAVSACIKPNEQIPLVCSSMHGEIQRTVGILNDICTGNGVSPTAFSLSVHNAIAGQLSIALNNRAPMLAIAPTEQGLLPALLEAAGMLNEYAEEVVVAFFDESVPEVLTGSVSAAAVQCVALRVSRHVDGSREQIFSVTKPAAANTKSAATIDDLVQFLGSDSAVSLLLCGASTDTAWMWGRQRG